MSTGLKIRNVTLLVTCDIKKPIHFCTITFPEFIMLNEMVTQSDYKIL